MLSGDEKRYKAALMADGKFCPDCGKTKNFADFAHKSDSKDGYQTRCRQCQYLYFQRHYKLNKEKYIERAKKWRDKNTKAEIQK